jgi:Sarcosine oxidase A3 domain
VRTAPASMMPGRSLRCRRRGWSYSRNDDGWRTAADAADAGITVEAIVDSRGEAQQRLAASACASARVFFGAKVAAAKGAQVLRAVDVVDASGSTSTIACDGLAISGGWNPSLHLTCHLGGKPRWREDIAAFVPQAAPPGMLVAGAANGNMSLSDCLKTGVEAGAAAAADCGFAVKPAAPPRAEDESVAITPLWWVKGIGKAFVDFQNDVTVADIALAEREGFRSVEHLKRYTTLGMATDQGRIGCAVVPSCLARSSLLARRRLTWRADKHFRNRGSCGAQRAYPACTVCIRQLGWPNRLIQKNLLRRAVGARRRARVGAAIPDAQAGKSGPAPAAPTGRTHP